MSTRGAGRSSATLRGLLAAGIALAVGAGVAAAQPRPGDTPNPVGGAPAAFRTGPADWSCRGGRCVYALGAGKPDHGWSRCTTSWFPTHGGWRKQNICR